MPDDPPSLNGADTDDGFAPAPLPLAGGFSLGGLGAPPTVFVPHTSTPLHEDDPESPIPAPALWAMKYRRHLTLSSRDPERLRERLGEGDGAVYVIDDGGRHTMVSRLVGMDEDGSTYCLVGRIKGDAYDRYAIGDADTDDIFDDARELALCSVFAVPDAVSNVIVAETYRSVADVPPEYLPPQPFLEFVEDGVLEGVAFEDAALEDGDPEDPAFENADPEDVAPEDAGPLGT
jgi:hypothetical protein